MFVNTYSYPRSSVESLFLSTRVVFIADPVDKPAAGIPLTLFLLLMLHCRLHLLENTFLYYYLAPRI